MESLQIQNHLRSVVSIVVIPDAVTDRTDTGTRMPNQKAKNDRPCGIGVFGPQRENGAKVVFHFKKSEPVEDIQKHPPGKQAASYSVDQHKLDEVLSGP